MAVARLASEPHARKRIPAVLLSVKQITPGTRNPAYSRAAAAQTGLKRGCAVFLLSFAMTGLVEPWLIRHASLASLALGSPDESFGSSCVT